MMLAGGDRVDIAETRRELRGLIREDSFVPPTAGRFGGPAQMVIALRVCSCVLLACAATRPKVRSATALSACPPNGRLISPLKNGASISWVWLTRKGLGRALKTAKIQNGQRIRKIGGAGRVGASTYVSTCWRFSFGRGFQLFSGKEAEPLSFQPRNPGLRLEISS